MNNVLAREASDIGTRTANIAPFDNCNVLALCSYGPGNVLTGFPTPQHNKVVFFQVGHEGLQEMNFEKQASMGLSESPEKL
jgi:hypothetical protein